MTVLWLDEQETRALEALLLAEDLSKPVELLRDCGFDCSTLFEYVDSSGLDFRGSDVNGVSFYGATLVGATMYRDQFDVIKATGPRNTNGVRLLDRTVGPSVTIEEFLAEHARMRRTFDETGVSNPDTLKAMLQRMPDLGLRAQALQALIDLNYEGLLAGFVEIAVRGATDQELERGGVASTRVAYLAMRLFRLDSVVDRLDVLSTAAPGVDVSHSVIQMLLGRGVKNVAGLKPAIDWLVSRGLQPHSLLLLGATSVPPKSFDPAEAIAAIDMIATSRAVPSLSVLRLIAQRARSFLDGHQTLLRMRRAGLKLDLSIYFPVAAKTRGMLNIRQLLSMILADGLRPTAEIFTGFITASRDWDSARKILLVMSEFDVSAERTVFHVLAEKASSLTQAFETLTLMREAGFEPDVTAFTRIADKANSLNDGREVLRQMRNMRVRPNSGVFTKLADKVGTMADVRELVEMMLEVDVPPDAEVFSRLADNAKGLPNADLLLDMMSGFSVKPNKAIFSRFADGAKSAADARGLLARMRRWRVVPDATVFARLADKMTTPGEAREFLGYMEDIGVEPGGVILSSLVGACITLSDATPFLERIRQKSETPRVQDLNKLLRNAPGAFEADRVYRAFSDYGLLPDHVSFNTLVAKQESYAACRAVVDGRRPDGVRLELFALNPMLRRSEKLQHVVETLEDFSSANLVPDSHSVRALLFGMLSLGEKRIGITRMMELGLRLELVDTSILGDKVQEFLDISTRS